MRGLTLSGFAVWDGKDGPSVTPPSASYTSKKTGKVVYKWLLNSTEEESADIYRLRQLIVDAYKKWEKVVRPTRREEIMVEGSD